MSGRQHCGAPTSTLRRVIPAGLMFVLYLNNDVLTFGEMLPVKSPVKSLAQMLDAK